MFRYVHIPFCRRRCLYCRFSLTTKWDAAALEKYAEAVVEEIRGFSAARPTSPLTRGVRGVGNSHAAPGGISTQNPLNPPCQGEGVAKAAKSVYFGGGTPSVMPPELLAKIMAAFRENGGIEKNAEVTLEANPEDVTPESLRACATLGVNRLSMGIQSFEPATHEEVSRTWRDPFALLETISAGPIKNVNLDFIAGLPRTPAGQLAPNLDRLLSRFPVVKHCSVYLLENETYPAKWKASSVPAEGLADEYAAAKAVLEKRGFARYEISNFAKPGFESRHNRAYWDRADYRGYGMAAESLVAGRRFGNAKTFAGYYAGKLEYEETLTAEQARLERVMTGLRTFSLALADVGDRAGLARAVRDGLAEIRGKTVRPTETGVALLDRLVRTVA